MLDVKKDFPILNRKINGKRLVYLDNAATSQIPSCVMRAVQDFEFNHRANVHRGVHTLSEEATEMYEEARKGVASFINAVVPSEVIFVRNATEAINLVAYGWGRKNLEKGDIILTTEIEHHSNLVPWQNLAKETKCSLEFVPVGADGELSLNDLKVDWSKVKLVALTHASNVLGTITDIKGVVKSIKKSVAGSSLKAVTGGPRFLVDGAQSVPHMPVNVQKLGIDFLAFSGHKMCGPMGIGVLWVKREVQEEMNEFLTGGGMIETVSLEASIYAHAPERFEAGTPNVSGAVGLAAACDYLSSIGMDKVRRHERELTSYALQRLSRVEGVTIYGPKKASERCGLVSFNIKRIHSHDLAAVLDTEGVAVRSGQHCVMPWHTRTNTNSTVRASFYIYNDKKDVDLLIKGIDKAKKILLN